MANPLAWWATVALSLLFVCDTSATSLGRRLSARAISFDDSDPSLKPAASDLEIVPAGTILHEVKPLTAASTSGTAPSASSSGVKYVTPLLTDQDHSKDRGYFEELVRYKDQLEEIRERKKETLKTAVVAAHYKIQQELYKRDEVLRKMEVLSLAINEQLERFARLEERFHEADDTATGLQHHVEDIIQEYKADEEADSDLIRSLEDQSELLKQHQDEGKPPSIDALDKAASDCHEANFTEEGEELDGNHDDNDDDDDESGEHRGNDHESFETAYADDNRALRGIPDGRYDVVHPDEDCVKRSALFQLNTHLSREIATSAQLKSLIAFLSSTAQSTSALDKHGDHHHEAGCSHQIVAKHAKDYSKQSDLIQKMYNEFEELNDAMQAHKSSECHAREFRKALDERMNRVEQEVRAGFNSLSHKTDAVNTVMTKADAAINDIQGSFEDLSSSVSEISDSNEELQQTLDEKINELVDAVSSPASGDTAARVQDFSARLQTLAAKLAQQVLGGQHDADMTETTPSALDKDYQGGSEDDDDFPEDASQNADDDEDDFDAPAAKVHRSAATPPALRTSMPVEDEFAGSTTESLEETTPSDSSTAAKLRFARRRLSDTISKSYHSGKKRRRSQQ